MRIRFFGSSDCRECMKIFILLNKFDVEYEYIDAKEDDDNIQNFCDNNEVEELPHLQFLIKNKVILRHVGPLTEEDFIGYLVDYFPRY